MEVPDNVWIDAQELTALRAELEQVRGERDEAKRVFAQWLDDHAEDHGRVKQLAAEGRALREALKLAELAVAYADCDTWATGSAWPTCDCDKCVATRAIDQAFSSAPLTAAEVARVKRLEAVAEAADKDKRECVHHGTSECYRCPDPVCAALAAWREGEAPDAHL